MMITETSDGKKSKVWKIVKFNVKLEVTLVAFVMKKVIIKKHASTGCPARYAYSNYYMLYNNFLVYTSL